MRSWKILPLAIVAILLSGCGQFFVKQTSTGSTTGTGNYLYVANQTVSSIAGFSLSSTALSVVSGSPVSLGVVPTSLARTPGGTFLYAGSPGGAIYGYSIGSNGALTILNSGSAVVSEISPTAIAVDPTGAWLIAVDPTPTAYVFSINSSTGLLTSEGSLALDTGTPTSIVFTPNNSLVYVALGTGGTDILTFASSTGALTKTSLILKPKQNLGADQALAVDPGSKFLFVAETGVNGVRVLSIGTNGALTEATGSPYATGSAVTSVLVDSTGSYVYVANSGSNNISAFLLSATGALTAISGSPFTTGTSPASLAEDTSDAFIAVACSGGSPDMQVFTISTTTPGALTNFATATTGTDPTGALVVVSSK